MGFAENPAGIVVSLFDKDGNQIDRFQASHSLFTTHKRQRPNPPSSPDWLKQIYVADSSDGLADLLKKVALQPEDPFATSGASLSVTVCVWQKGTINILPEQSVIADGTKFGTDLSGNDIFLTDTLDVVDHKDIPSKFPKGHPLRDHWDKQVVKFQGASPTRGTPTQR